MSETSETQLIDIQTTLDKLLSNALNINKKEIKKTLLLYEERIILLGDACARFDKLGYFRSFLNNTAVHINFKKNQNFGICDGLLKNSPHIEHISTLEWEDIDFGEYDIVFCITFQEEQFLEFLHGQYRDQIIDDRFKPVIFSISQLMLTASINKAFDNVFPLYEGLLAYCMNSRAGQLHLGREEQDWGNKWLESKGVKKNENIFIVVDASGGPTKLLKGKIYFRLLKFLLKRKNSKVLIFDENNIGKEAYYAKALGKRRMEKMIFSKNLSLRDNMCLIGSGYVKLIFGPCTGIMHCSSGIYNDYASNGMAGKDIPLIIVYTGRLGKYNYDVNIWWGNSPLVKCLLLMKKGWRKKIVLLDSLSAAEKKDSNSLGCGEYTGGMLIKFIKSRLTIN